MAFSYKQRECATCGGTLRYDRSAKVYVCIYCGNRYEREESYDGQFSPRNAAVQTLTSLLDVDADMGNWNIVQTNLNDCQKVDPNYPGIIVARIAASIKRVQLMMGKGREAVRTDAAAAQDDYRRLGSPFDPAVNDVEADFYEHLESADVRSLLISVFNTFHDTERVDYISQGFDAEGIHSEQAASDLMSRAFGNRDYAQIDKLLQSPAKLDADALFARILDEYPGEPSDMGERKLGNASTVIMRGMDPQHGRDTLSRYMAGSADPMGLKVRVALACVARGVIPDGKAIAEVIAMQDVSQGNADVITLLGSLKGGALTDDDTAAVVEALLAYADVDTMTKGLNALANDGYYLTFTQDAAMDMLTRSDINVEGKTATYRAMTSIGLSERRRQSIIAAYVEAPVQGPQGPQALQDKVRIVDMLAAQVNGINPMNVERYLMDNHADGAAKPQVLAALLAHVTSFASLGMAAARYASSPTDGPGVREAVIGVLRQRGLLR